MTNTQEERRSAARHFPKIDQRRRKKEAFQNINRSDFHWMAFLVPMFCGSENIKCPCVGVSCCPGPAQLNTIFDFFFFSCLLQGSLYASRRTNSRRCRHTLHHGLIASSDWLWLRALQPHKISPRLSLSLCFCPGYREGFLWKRGRDNGQFLSRKFILAEREGALKYFNKQDVSEIKTGRFKGPVSSTSRGSAEWNLKNSNVCV